MWFESGGEERWGTAHLGYWPCPMNILNACEWNHSKRPAHPLVHLSFFSSKQSWTIHFQSLIYRLWSQHNLAWYQQALVFWPHPVFLTLLVLWAITWHILSWTFMTLGNLQCRSFSRKSWALPPAISAGFVLCLSLNPSIWLHWESV